MALDVKERRPGSRMIFSHVEQWLYIALATLISITCVAALAGSADALVRGLADWSSTDMVFSIIDRLLVVLMLVEILHTVLVSVKSGTLVPEPFLIVGLIASIRRILVITLETAQHGGVANGDDEAFRASMIELGVLGVLILVMVTSIYMLRHARPSEREVAAHEGNEGAKP
jgi:phosphate starvation-inducible membrane PsiE